MSKRGYDFYLGRLRLPVTPEKCELRVKNRNETLPLLAGGELNLLRDPGLSEIEFTCLLPQTAYPFAYCGEERYIRSAGTRFRPAAEYLAEIERLKVEKKPFQFIVARRMPTGRTLFSTNLKVSLEEYTIEEDAGNGFDVLVHIRLKQYREAAVRTVAVALPETPADSVEETPQPAPEPQPVRPESTVQPEKPVTLGCDVILNGQVHRDSYGSGPGAVFSGYRGRVNFINGGAPFPYHVATPAGGWLGWVAAGCVKAV